MGHFLQDPTRFRKSIYMAKLRCVGGGIKVISKSFHTDKWGLLAGPSPAEGLCCLSELGASDERRLSVVFINRAPLIRRRAGDETDHLPPLVVPTPSWASHAHLAEALMPVRKDKTLTSAQVGEPSPDPEGQDSRQRPGR